MVTCTEVIDCFIESLRDGLNCETLPNGALSIVTPFVTVDGDSVEVFVSEAADGTLLVSDLGESTRYLAGHGIDFRDSVIRNEYLDQIVATLAIDFDGSRVQVQVSKEEIGEGILRIVEACRFLSDMVYTGRSREESEFRDSVKSVLKNLARRVEEGKDAALKGKSGKDYTADFYVANEFGGWIDLVTGVRKSTFQNRLLKAHAMFFDANPEVRRLTIIDDLGGLADPTDFKFMEPVSKVVPWSRQDLISEQVSLMTHR